MGALERLGLADLKETQTRSYSVEQAQTSSCFEFKWSKRETYESDALKEQTRRWLFERYCEGDPQKLNEWLNSDGIRKIILDAGCGSGFSSLLFFAEHLMSHDYLGVDISRAVDVARTRFLEAGMDGDFLMASLDDLPIPEQSVDLIFSEGVLHHTDNTERAIKYLSAKLKRGGRFLFYVYAKKSPIREFTDDYIREYLKPLSNEEAWEALKPLTKLGITLGELGAEIDIAEDIPFLGIRKGKIDLQRLFYWTIVKLYYRPEYTHDEMNHINFDWFRPLNCHRHTKEEVISFCEKANLKVEHLNIQEAGISVVAQKG
ncbi:MAG: class I SAM-dependent methyltransferase [Acidobacteriota bacterium]|nr:class I SAM-dependent methyltransferase [Acidobacteriota bacterium]